MKDRISKGKRFSPDEISVFCDHIANMLNSGISLYEGISILRNEVEDARTKELFHEIEMSLQARMSLSKALSKTEAFPKYVIHMVSIGETAGSLEKVMHSLSAYYERESKVLASIKKSIAYPTVLFLMISLILWALVFRILPLFESMYQELSAEVAKTSDSLMSFGLNTGFISVTIIMILVLIFLLIFLAYRTKKGEEIIKGILYNFPVVKSLSYRISRGKFISSMAMMLPSGIDTRQALDLAMETLENPKVLTKVKECKRLVESGISLENAIRTSNIVTGMDSNIIIVAAKSGNMDTAFLKLSERYNDEATDLLSKVATYVETVLVILLAVLIGLILLSVMLPLMNIISSIG